MVANALNRSQSVTLEDWSFDLIRNQQNLCPVIKEVKAWLTMGTPLFHREAPNLTLGKDKILWQKCKESKDTAQLVLPAVLRPKVLEMLHNDIGHLGATKTKYRVHEKYFWLYMAVKNEEWCNKCIICQQRRNPVPENRALFQLIVMTCPGELVTMEIVEYLKRNIGSQYCLVMIDHFTKWLELFPLRNQQSETVAKKIVDGWIPRHGAPEQLHSDQGTNLNSKTSETICKELEVLKMRNSPYHPQSDGASERSI